MNNYRFIIVIFGEKHIGMLLTNLYSIIKNAPNASVSVFWQDVNNEYKNDFKKSFPKVNFNETNFNIASNKITRISSKVLLWNYAAKKFNNEKLCFIDVDTLVLKDIGHFFNNDFDVLFTYKEDFFSLNTGVLLCKGEFYSIFFEEWLRSTLEILNDSKSLTQATSTKYPYGGADQMSFYKMIDYKRGVDTYEVLINEQRIKFKGIPCKILNETNSTAITDYLYIIHYKGGWQIILLEGGGFTKNRSKKDSWEMYMYYLNTYKDALIYLNKNLDKNYIPGSFLIEIPFYINKINFKENRIKYLFFDISFKIKSFFKKVFNYLQK